MKRASVRFVILLLSLSVAGDAQNVGILSTHSGMMPMAPAGPLTWLLSWHLAAAAAAADVVAPGSAPRKVGSQEQRQGVRGR